MNRAIVMILALAFVAHATARAALAPTTSARSFSGQFEAYAPAASIARSPTSAFNDGAIVLAPDLLVVSCERIKQGVWRKLDAKPTWRGKISVTLYPAPMGNATVGILSQRGPGGWSYRVSMPDVMDTNRFVRAIVQVLLMEIANRHAGMHPAEVPSWLAEGLAQDLMCDSGAELLLQPPTKKEGDMIINRMIVDQWQTNSLAQAKRILSARPPLTFDQLSWPGEDSWSGESSEIFRGSAQLFVHRLLGLKNGPACLRAMLDQLPRRYNWQFAFYDAFQNWFKQSLDVEKWWALQLVEFSGRDLTQTWTVDESWKKLDGVLRAPIEVRTRVGDLPMRAEVTLQTIIREWDVQQQTQFLANKMTELDTARLRISQDLILLVDDYRQVVGGYLEKRRSSRSLTFMVKRRTDASLDAVALEAIRNLDVLDARREALRPQPTSSVTAAADADDASTGR